MAVDLAVTAHTLVQEGKGILALDETPGTIGKRFEALGIPSTADTRRAYRELLVTAPELQQVISGVILQDETFRQTTSSGLTFPETMIQRGILPGIKVDTGAKPMAGAPGEKVTEGLDGLRERIAEYVERGARFAKWRAVITIGDGTPTPACIAANAHALARYAALCQEGGLVPIVEPEVLMDGDHSIETCFKCSVTTWRSVFAELVAQAVALEAMVLKPSMILPGKQHSPRASVDEVGRWTMLGLRQAVPAAVPGIAFLSGGQSPELATDHLHAINAVGPRPWQLTFSYGRALQDPALSAWQGEARNIGPAQEALLHRTGCVAGARSAGANQALAPYDDDSQRLSRALV
ncbi:MAG TPA: class I fructose-bisphosphate aldolase [Candidatus Dormibacteraeota bacterium]|nr:class I fructose-bisphosphate aldolase [Candidatus Dormibacteraeota bacterium]